MSIHAWEWRRPFEFGLVGYGAGGRRFHGAPRISAAENLVVGRDEGGAANQHGRSALKTWRRRSQVIQGSPASDATKEGPPIDTAGVHLGPVRARSGRHLRSEPWNFVISADRASKSRPSPTETGSRTARRSRTTSPTQCVRAALDSGITSFDTADVYANGAAETVLGEALKGERRESLEIFTKVYWPTGPKGHNDVGLSRKHIAESINLSLTRLQTDYVDLYQAHRFDPQTPLEETMQAFAQVVRQGKALYIGVSEWTAEQIRAGHALAVELGIQLISSQPQYSMLWRVIEQEVVPTSRELGVSQIVWSPVAQGVLSGKYQPGAAPPAGSRATDEKGGANMIKRFMNDDVLTRVQALRPIAEELDLTMAQLAVAWVLSNDNVAAALVGASRPEQVRENVKAAGVTLSPEVLTRIDDALGDVVTTDPGQTAKNSPQPRPA